MELISDLISIPWTPWDLVSISDDTLQKHVLENWTHWKGYIQMISTKKTRLAALFESQQTPIEEQQSEIVQLKKQLAGVRDQTNAFRDGVLHPDGAVSVGPAGQAKSFLELPGPPRYNGENFQLENFFYNLSPGGPL
ncbi:MAG: hypothetical protein M1814_004348 [Vezdaea aestivalis]|nr:MAG: hypothetical protein M1814_004348 [Vezdaea aestivalis]